MEKTKDSPTIEGLLQEHFNFWCKLPLCFGKSEKGDLIYSDALIVNHEERKSAIAKSLAHLFDSIIIEHDFYEFVLRTLTQIGGEISVQASSTSLSFWNKVRDDLIICIEFKRAEDTSQKTSLFISGKDHLKNKVHRSIEIDPNSRDFQRDLKMWINSYK
jgi:hypothetical protein